MQKTISKNFIMVDEENFNVVETRETTTEVNHKRINIELKTFRTNLKSDVTTVLKNENAIRVGCERFNAVIDDLEKAVAELKLDIVVPARITYEELKQEIIDEEKAVQEQVKAEQVAKEQAKAEEAMPVEAEEVK